MLIKVRVRVREELGELDGHLSSPFINITKDF